MIKTNGKTLNTYKPISLKCSKKGKPTIITTKRKKHHRKHFHVFKVAYQWKKLMHQLLTLKTDN